MFELRVDPVTFEVLRHRLWSINEEAATALRITSGSPVASEVRDMNTTILDADGECVIMGPYVATHGIGQNLVVKYILREHRENPGINRDDMFICSDPYAGVPHQNDVALVAPVHWEGELIAWTGATIHETDVGGPVHGSQASVGAQSIYEEAPPMPPMKLIEGGVIRKDIEAEYLIRSRTRELNALDLKAKIASNNVAKRRILELVAKYGVETFKGVMSSIIDYTEWELRKRIAKLADGTWRHVSYLDYDDGFKSIIYPVRLTMTKKGDRLTFDFTQTAAQAPAIINCTYSGLCSGTTIAVLAFLCYDIPWSPAGVLRAIGIVSKPGTLVHAAWPAGVCKATTSGSQVVTTSVSVCLAKMLGASENSRDLLMCPWNASTPAQELFGVDQRGQDFGATVLDSQLGGGGGARSYKDGIDTGGMLRILSLSIPNVETYEFRYPVLYLRRRQEADSGGPGKFRGGVAISCLTTPHDVDVIPTNIMHTFGAQQPEGVGIFGGYPASTALYAVKRGSDVLQQFREGRLPREMEQLSGEIEYPAPISKSPLKKGDIYMCVSCGGGGYGDPTERDPQAVARDVECGTVSLEGARDLYGVVVDPKGFKVVEDETRKRRSEIMEERSRKATPMTPRGPVKVIEARADGARRLSEYLWIDRTLDGPVIRCRCGAVLSAADRNYKEGTLRWDSPLREAGRWINPQNIGGQKFEFRRFICPSCLILLDTEIALKEEPIRWDLQPAVDGM